MTRLCIIAALLFAASPAAAALPATNQCLGVTLDDARTCGPSRHGWYFDKTSPGMRTLHLMMRGVDWLTLTPSGSTLTLSSDAATTLVINENLTFGGTVAMTGPLQVGASAPLLNLYTEAIWSPSDATNALFTVNATDAAGTTIAAAGIGMYGPSHTTHPSTLGLFGTTFIWASDILNVASPMLTLNSSGFSDMILNGGAAALTFAAAASSVLMLDNSATGLVWGSTGNTAGVTYSTVNNAEEIILAAGQGFRAAYTEITGVTSLDASDCGKNFSVTAGLDGATITLPDADAVPGCELSFAYVGADAGLLLDISPLDSDADGIEGGCYETATDTIIYFSGTADADIGLTKASSLTGNGITVWACGAAMWCTKDCLGIWANN